MKGRLLVCLLLVGARALAQQQLPSLEKGFQPEKLYHFNDLDHVNLFNGNLVVALPIGLTYPLNGGLSYNLVLSYNSNVWDLSEGPNGTIHSTPAARSNAGLGWVFGMGRFIPHNDPTFNLSGNFDLYEAPDGGDHRFDGARSTDTGCGTFGCPAYTTDGTSLRLRYSGTNVREIDFPDGVTRRYEKNSQTGLWDLRKISTARGSGSVSVTPSTLPDMQATVSQCPGASSYWQISDSAGRTHFVCFVNRSVDTVARPMVDRVVLASAQGTIARYLFGYEANVTISKSIQDTDSNSGSWSQTHTVPMLTSVTLADTSTYVMSYYKLGGWAPGALQTIQLPTKGTIAYTFEPYLIPTLIFASTTLARASALDPSLQESAAAPSLPPFLRARLQ